MHQQTSNMPEQNNSRPRPMSWSKRIAIAFLSLTMLVMLILAIALSPIGVGFLVNQANQQDNIHIQGFEGSFYSDLRFDNIRFKNEALSLDAQQVALGIEFNCLFSGQLCLSQLRAKHLEIILAQNDAPNTSEALNEYLELPIDIRLPNIYLGSFQLAQTNAQSNAQEPSSPLLDIKNLKVSAQANKTFTLNQLNINELNLYLPSTEQSSSTAAQDAPHWLEQLFELEYHAIDIPRVFIPINARLNKAKIDTFCLYQPITDTLESDTLSPRCVANNHIHASVHKQQLKLELSTQMQAMAVQSVNINASVNFAKHYMHELLVSIQPNKDYTSDAAQAIQLSVKGDTTSTAIIIKSAQVEHLKAQIDLELQKAALPLSVNAQLMRVQTLLAAWLPTLQQAITSVSLNVSGNTQNYKIVASGKLANENAGLLDVVADVSLLDKRLVISKFTSSGNIGLFNAKSSHHIAQQNGQLALINKLDVEFDDFNYAPLLVKSTDTASNSESDPLLENMGSALFGKIFLEGQYTQNSLSGTVLCENIRGKVRTYELSLLCDISLSADGLLKIANLSLFQGENEIRGKGSVQLPNIVSVDTLADNMKNMEQAASDFTLQIDAPNLGAFYSGLSGQITGEIGLQGSVDSAVLQANIQADKLKLASFSLQAAHININTSLSGNWPSTLEIRASELAQQDLLADTLSLRVSGDVEQHTIVFTMQHPQYGAEHRFSGEAVLDPNDFIWRGTWESGEWRLPFDTFAIAQPIDINVKGNNISVSEHCWTGQSPTESLCINRLDYADQVAKLDALLSYNMNAPLLHFYPSIIQAGTSMPMQSDISLSFSQTDGLGLDAYNLITQSTLVTSKHRIDLSAIVANMRLHDDVLNTNVFAGTHSTGAIGLRSELNLLPEQRAHKGELRIEQFDIAPLLRFVPGAEKLAGVIHGTLGFDGAISAPNVNGRLTVDQGELILDNYPYPFSNFNQSIDIVNNKAMIEGEFELGAGDAQYSATAIFDESFTINGMVRGAGMQIAYQNSELLASPNIRFDITPNNIKLNGEIAIPNAQFEIKELPKSAKAPSSDTIIVGKPAEPPLVPIGLDIDLRLLIDVPKLGRVNINALDLEATLAGDLRLRLLQKNDVKKESFSPLQTYLSGNINVLSGNYEAYGQKLQIRSGEIYFNGPPSLPQFDINAIRNPLNTEDQVVAGIRISGNPVIPKVELFSEPAMIQARQLSYLLNGTDLDGGAGTSNNTMLVNTLVGFGVGSSGNGINRLGKSIGFDSLNIQTAGQGTNTQVQVTGRISDNIQVTYGVGLFDSASQIILKYKLLPKLYIEAVASAESTVDLFYEMTRTEN